LRHYLSDKGFVSTINKYQSQCGTKNRKKVVVNDKLQKTGSVHSTAPQGSQLLGCCAIDCVDHAPPLMQSDVSQGRGRAAGVAVLSLLQAYHL